MRELADRYQRLKEKLWWFDVIYPVALAALLFISLTHVVYSGKASGRLSFEAETKLLEYSLEISSGRPVRNSGDVLVVSGSALDVVRDPQSTEGAQLSLDFSIEAYAKVVSQLADRGVKQIFLSMNPDVHQSNADFSPLWSAIGSIHQTAKVFVMMPPGQQPKLPASLSTKARALSDNPGWYPDRLYTINSYNRKWGFWISQLLADQHGRTSEVSGATDDESPGWAAKRFASNYPSYIVNISHPRELPSLSFNAVARGDFQGLSGSEPPLMAFVGCDLSGSLSSSLTRRFVLTAYDATNVQTTATGTPLHFFWAAVAQMFRDGAQVYIPSDGIIRAVSLLFCFFVGLVMWYFGGAVALGMFLVYVFSGPYVNGVAIRHLGVYLPLFDSYYFGLATFIMAGFGRLSFSAFQRWRLDEQTRMHATTADLKGNFVSLLSHNLNTPVAKMQGMLSLLQSQPGDQPWKSDIQQATALVAQLEYSIRGVLIAMALEEGSLNESGRNIVAIRNEFDEATTPGLRRLGLKVRVLDAIATDEDMLMLPLHFDQRALLTGIAALAALFAREDKQVPIDLQFATVPARGRDPDTTIAPTPAGGPRGYEQATGELPLHQIHAETPFAEDLDEHEALQIRLSSREGWISASAAEILSAGDNVPVRSIAGQTFFTDVMAGLALRLAITYQGSFLLTPDGAGGSVELNLQPSSS